jgi:hypothetical protein
MNPPASQKTLVGVVCWRYEHEQFFRWREGVDKTIVIELGREAFPSGDGSLEKSDEDGWVLDETQKTLKHRRCVLLVHIKTGTGGLRDKW